jgi:hypothetical protein
MSLFAAKILLATDGSDEAELAARTATELAEKTGSELHVVYAQPIPLPVDPRPDDPFLDIIGPYAGEVIKDIYKGEGTEDTRCSGRTGKSRWGHCSASPSEDRRPCRRDHRPSRGDGGRADSVGEPRSWRGRTGPHGQRLRVGCSPRPLPRLGGSRCPARVAGEEDMTDVWRSLSERSRSRRWRNSIHGSKEQRRHSV